MKHLKLPLSARFYAQGIFLASICLFFLLSASHFSIAQSPNQFSYQGIARSADGKIIINASIKLRLSIYEKLSAEAVPTTLVFQEIHDVQTNAFGVFNVAVGSVNGGIGPLDWAASDKTFFLGVEFDPLGGSAFVDLGKTQLLSVPSAMFAHVAGKWMDFQPIIQKGVEEIGQEAAGLPQVGKGARLIWYPKKAAFRAGYTDDDWEDILIGQSSFAAGKETRAIGDQSVAMGDHAIAKESGSIGLGDGAVASGMSSVAAGEHVIAKAQASIALGGLNDISDISSVDPHSKSEKDRIFELGNGTTEFDRSNAMTVLRNGHVGIGSNVLAPEYLLDLGARARIRHNPGATAGIHFNNSQNNIDGFAGMRADGEVGFYVGGKWAFWVNGQGEGRLNGAMIQTSDRRLKKDITSLHAGSLSKLSKVNGYFFRWNDGRTDQSVQTGLIAQEVESIFPELVKTDEKGFKSVNYIGMIPHLIESVKELKSKTDEIAALRKELEQVKALSEKIEKLEAAMSRNGGAPSKMTGR